MYVCMYICIYALKEPSKNHILKIIFLKYYVQRLIAGLFLLVFHIKNYV